MKNLTLGLFAAFVLILFIQSPVKASTENVSVAIVSTADMSVLVARIETIRAIDFSTLNASEKKELRNELRTIKTELKKSNKSDVVATHVDGGIFLSVGAIVVIILLLILIL